MNKRRLKHLLFIPILLLFTVESYSVDAVYGVIRNYTIEVNDVSVLIRGGILSTNIGNCNNPGWLTLCHHTDASCKIKTSVALTAFVSKRLLWIYFRDMNSCPNANYLSIQNVQIR